MKSLRAFASAILVLAMLGAAGAESIITSKHNLSASGLGSVKASTESEICVFCHTPHAASGEAPLWNRNAAATVYQPYTSTTAIAAPGQPTGASKLCLSCHDGTIALGMVRSRSAAIAMAGSSTLPVGNSSRIDSDLRDDHPVSFAYTQALATANGELVSPATLTGAVRLDGSGQLQCTACHDAHDNANTKFLVKPAASGALCVTCHQPTAWAGSVHATSTASWTGVAPDPWPHTAETTVATNACENCHRPHAAGTPARLLNFAPQEANCLSCHNGKVAAVGKNIEADFAKASKHLIALNDSHDPTENAINPGTRHVECADCHNPHRSTATLATLPAASGALAGVRGVNAAGSVVANVTYEYELCFRCHADSLVKGTPIVARNIVQANTRLEFATTNRSFHPVVAANINANVTSLISPYTKNSVIGCTSCHNSNSSTVGGGTGANGPHGSTYDPILALQYLTADNTTESAANYALCYKCHSRTSILADASFAFHKKHIQGFKAPCAACHDSHGVASNAHLINFASFVTASSNGRLEFIEGATANAGTCSLRCHGGDHKAWTYP
jgi:predicted CXXCH cytochrome family protein